MKKQSHHIEYHPPSDETIARFVHDVSLRLATQYENDAYLDPTVTWGLTAFIKHIAEVKARQLNEARNGSVFDKP